MDDDRVDESSNESSNEGDVQSEESEADQLDAHLEKNEVCRQWLDMAQDNATVANGKIQKVPGAGYGGSRCQRKGPLENNAQN